MNQSKIEKEIKKQLKIKCQGIGYLLLGLAVFVFGMSYSLAFPTSSLTNIQTVYIVVSYVSISIIGAGIFIIGLDRLLKWVGML